MAKKKAGGSTSLGRDSIAKRLGIKLFDGQFAHAGSILVRQRGTGVHAGNNVKMGGDDTLFAAKSGTVKFISKQVRMFNGKLKKRKYVSVEPVSVKK